MRSALLCARCRRVTLIRQCPHLARCMAPVAVAVAAQGSLTDTPLEAALSQSSADYRERPGEVLRNYGWLTVLSDEMAERVGGADRLRASGTFVDVEPLAAGGWWLLATETWDEYGPEQANRLFELLAPVLPAGRPEMTQWRSPTIADPPVWSPCRTWWPNATHGKSPVESTSRRLVLGGR
ncbi:hypothetical protein NIE79_004532 [Micromonospora sp. NIE79]|uniref:DUF3291 domain-containing protein n=1 Tax=Micromonospora trifolii TaxID=2911208 RepID=A0ABS9N7R5_9ACTN|nr:hypothetical protein [Micromonospora trifolii]MCG5446002.1 hypothetical protein [Micromonospora trifolii]